VVPFQIIIFLLGHKGGVSAVYVLMNRISSLPQIGGIILMLLLILYTPIHVHFTWLQMLKDKNYILPFVAAALGVHQLLFLHQTGREGQLVLHLIFLM
jgi:hypothetical protein